MATRDPSPAKYTTFRVWADRIDRVFQDVETNSPKRAYELAKKRPKSWEECDEHLYNGYRLSNEVLDISGDEFVPVYGTKHCSTCRSEIVESINESNFREGECGPCEYERYRSQPMLLAASRSAHDALSNLGYRWYFRWSFGCKSGDGVLGQLISAINAYDDAA